MLMLSDCLPAAGQGKRSERAWRLLCCASTTHQVHLVFHASQPVNLVQWRLIAGLAQRVHIERGRFRRRRMAPIGGEAGDWLRTRRFDALLVNSHRMWPSGDTTFADYTICDFANDPDHAYEPAESQGGWLSRLTRPLPIRALVGAKTQRMIDDLDYALFADDHMARRLKPKAHHTVVIPEVTAEDEWAHLIHSIHPPVLTASPVTVMPMQPQHRPARKAA